MFDLASIQRTRKHQPAKLLIYSAAGVGKTQFAASAPAAVGILTENGSAHVDAMAFPLANSLADVYSAIGTLFNQPHNFQSVYLDSLDWLEPLLHAHVCAREGWKNIEQPGYGKGYVAAENEWRQLLAGLDALSAKRGMHVILIAHDKAKTYSPPTGDAYERFTLKLHDRASNVVTEWADHVGYAALQVILDSKDGKFGATEKKAITSGRRLLHLAPHPAYVAKTRSNITAPIDLNWSAFSSALYAEPPNPTLTTALQPGVTQPIVPEQQPDVAAGQQDPAASTQTDDQFART